MKSILLVSVLLSTENRPQTKAFADYETFSEWRRQHMESLLQYTVQHIPYFESLESNG